MMLQPRGHVTMSKPLSVLIPIQGFGTAGGYRVLSKLADQWIELGCRVAFLAPTWSELPHYPTRAELFWVDVAGRPTAHSGKRQLAATTFGKGLALAQSLLALWRGIPKVGGPWDVLLANHSMTAWPVAFQRLPARKVYYVQAYEPEYFADRPGFNNKLLRVASWGSYHLPLQRVANAAIYGRYGACRAESWVPPGLDFGDFFPPSDVGDRLVLGRPGLRVGCIGRVERDKGTAPAIAAYRAFTKDCPGNHRLRLADFGVPPTWLEGVSGLERVVPRNDRELGEYYRSLDVLLALGTQQHGAHHYPVLEAMATGVSVVTTGYSPATSSNSWIVGAGHVEAAQALREVWCQEAEARARSDRARVAIRGYAWDVVASQFLDLLRGAPGTVPEVSEANAN